MKKYIYYVNESALDITKYTLERFCELFNGENCGYNSKTGESDETLISDNNFYNFKERKNERFRNCNEISRK